MDYAAKIKLAMRKHDNPQCPPAEKAAIIRLIERMRIREREQGSAMAADPDTWGKYYRLPDGWYGLKYAGHYIDTKTINQMIRADINMSRKIGRMAAKPGAMNVVDPIADAPQGIRFFVRGEHYSGGRSIFVTIKGVPADWWIKREDPHWPGESFPAPGPRLEALAKAVWDIVQAYNYDRSDSMVDYFDTNFYAHVSADGSARPDRVPNPYPTDINCYHL